MKNEVELVTQIDELSTRVNRITEELAMLKGFFVNFMERHGIARPAWLVSQTERSPGRRATDEISRHEQYQRHLDWAEIWDKQGNLSEDIIAPCLGPLLGRMLGVKPNDVCLVQVRQVRRHPQDRQIQECFHCIAEYGEYVIVHVSNRMLACADVDKFILSVRTVWEFFPEYRDRRFVGCIAGLYSEPHVVSYAAEKGIIVLAIGSGEEYMDIKNELGFIPTVFQFTSV